MTAARLLGPDKRRIKASSNINPSFYFVLSDFFHENHCFYDSKRMESQQESSYRNR